VTTGGGGGPYYYDWQPTGDIDRALRDLGYRNYVVTSWSPESVERDPAKRLENFVMIIYWAGANPNPLVFNINEYPNLKEKLSFFLENGGILLIDGSSPSAVGLPTLVPGGATEHWGVRKDWTVIFGDLIFRASPIQEVVYVGIEDPYGLLEGTNPAKFSYPTVSHYVQAPNAQALVKLKFKTTAYPVLTVTSYGEGKIIASTLGLILNVKYDRLQIVPVFLRFLDPEISSISPARRRRKLKPSPHCSRPILHYRNGSDTPSA
jgi:hypothetical protein